MVELYPQGKTPDSSTRARWQYYQQGHLVAKQEELTKEINFCPTKYLFHTSKRSLTRNKILRHGSNGFTSLPKEGVLWIFITLKKSIALGRV
jgi:hypothetical protein